MGFWWSHTANCPAYISKSSVHTHPIITLLEGCTQKWLTPGSFLPPPQGPFKNWTPNFYHDAECYTFLCACNCPEHQALSPENTKFRTTTPSAVKPSVNFLTVEREASMLASWNTSNHLPRRVCVRITWGDDPEIAAQRTGLVGLSLPHLTHSEMRLPHANSPISSQLIHSSEWLHWVSRTCPTQWEGSREVHQGPLDEESRIWKL